MRAVIRFLPLLLAGWSSGTLAQQNATSLVDRLRQEESDIVSMYLEYQKLYYEDKSRTNELQAFEELLSVYIDQSMEIFETLNLVAENNQEARDIVSRALAFKALMFLEKAPLNNEYYEKACYEYYASLDLYAGTNIPPVLYKDLPAPIISGSRIYYRLVDLFREKGARLRDFGKVKLSFRNFMVTANFDPASIELVKLEEPSLSSKYTYQLAETRIRTAFEEVFQKSSTVETYVALPQGTYVLRLTGAGKDFSALTRFYVRASQEQHYIMEPLADWIILYEKPASKRPDFTLYQRRKSLLANNGLPGDFGFRTRGNGTTFSRPGKGAPAKPRADKKAAVSAIALDLLSEDSIKMIFEAGDSTVSDSVIEIIAESVVNYVESPSYYNHWNHWAASWQISNKVRVAISPGNVVPIELVSLVYRVIESL